MLERPGALMHAFGVWCYFVKKEVKCQCFTCGPFRSTRIFHESRLGVTATGDMDVPSHGPAGYPGGTPIFAVSLHQFMKHPG